MKHLSDTQLQLYLDGGLSSENKAAAAHLSNCDLCKSELELYKTVYAELKCEENDKAVRLSSDFADNIIAALPEIKTKKKLSFSFLSSDSFMFVAAAVLMITALVYYDFSQSFVPLKNVLLGAGGRVLSYSYFDFSIFSEYAKLSNSIVEYAIASVALILFYGRVEKIIHFFKNKTATFSI